MPLLGRDNATSNDQNSFEKLIIEIGNGRYMDVYDTYTALLSFFVKYMANSMLASGSAKNDSFVPKDKIIQMLHVIKSSINIAVNYVVVESAAAAQLSKLTLSLSTHLKKLDENNIDFIRFLDALYFSFIELLKDYENKIKDQCSSMIDYVNLNTTLIIPPGRYLNTCISTWKRFVPMIIFKHRHLKHPYKPKGKYAFLPSLPYLRGKAETIVLESVLVTSDKALVPPGTTSAVKELNPKNIVIITIPPALAQASSLTPRNIRPVVEYMMENGEIVNAFNREILDFSKYNVYILTGKDVLTKSMNTALSAKILSISKDWNREFASKVIKKYISLTSNEQASTS